jgi:hypothetical protein
MECGLLTDGTASRVGGWGMGRSGVCDHHERPVCEGYLSPRDGWRRLVAVRGADACMSEDGGLDFMPSLCCLVCRLMWRGQVWCLPTP